MDWGLISVILWPIGVIVAGVVGYFISQRFYKRRQPVWAYYMKKIIERGGDAPSELVVTFGGRSVNTVYRTTLVFFNKGNDTIDSIHVKRKVTIPLGQVGLLREPTVKSNCDAIEFSARKVLSQSSESIELDFSFLDQDDGAAIEVIHERPHALNKQTVIPGVIEGVKKMVCLGQFVPYKRPDLVAKLKTPGSRLVIILGSIYFGFSIYAGVRAKSYTIVAFVAGAIVLFCLFWLLIQLRQNKFPKWTSDIEL